MTIDFLQQIHDDVKDIFEHNIETTEAYTVPSRDDQGLTFLTGVTKKGKLIKTCVLFIDIRNSTKITRELQNDKVRLGKIYSSFIHSMTTIADEYGFVRNIVGDRVMVVFDPANCYVNAVNCAAAMYAVANKIIKRFSGLENFNVGIGIDFGEMLVLKTGIKRKHEEQSEYKGLVWVGNTANLASKLTDCTSKEYFSVKYRITYERTLITKVLKGYKAQPMNLMLPMPLYSQKPEEEYEYKGVTNSYSVTLNEDEFNRKIAFNGVEMKYDGHKVSNVIKEIQNGTASPVLMSGRVYEGLKKAEPKSIHLSRISEKNYPGIQNVGSRIYGGNPFYTEVNQIKIQ